MSVEWVAALVGAAVAVAGLVTAIRWVRSVDWRFVWREIPAYFYAAWEAERRIMGTCCTVIASGLLGLAVVYMIYGTRYDGQVPAPEGLTLIASALALAGGTLFLLASMGDFVWHLMSGNVYEPGLNAVYEQKALGDADLADERKISEALTGDAAFLEPSFEE